MDFIDLFFWHFQSDFVILVNNNIFQYGFWTNFKWFHKWMKP
jgi:hypothetical protein